MLPTLEATHHNEQLLLMNWPSQMGTGQFLILKGDRMPFLHQHTSYCKYAYIGMYLKWFSKVEKLKNKQDNLFFFQHPKCIFLLLSPFK